MILDRISNYSSILFNKSSKSQSFGLRTFCIDIKIQISINSAVLYLEVGNMKCQCGILSNMLQSISEIHTSKPQITMKWFIKCS